ncbi:MAG: hypothetical protein Q4A17_13240 [Thermoguttaceae bacterium]|nr:hypothetical protein [Thermoguttaceae bacterium]
MKILIITLITLAVLVLAGWFLLFRSVPLKVSPETTILTEPLTEDGRWVDYRSYFIAQFPKDGNTEKNSARGMVALFGSGDMNFKPEHWKMLGLEPFDENRKAPFEIPEPLLLNEKFEYCCKIEDYLTVDPEAVHEYVAAASPALDAMAEVIQNAEYYAFPFVFQGPDDLTEALLDIRQIREIALLFAFRADLREKDGDLEGADADRLIMLKFGRQIQNEGHCTVELLVGKAVENGGIEDLKDRKKMETLEPIDREANLRRALENERIWAASYLQYVCRTGNKSFCATQQLNGYSKGLCWFISHLGYDWNVVTKRMNEISQKAYFPEENAEPYEPPRYWSLWELPFRRARSEFLADFLTSSLGDVQLCCEKLLEDEPASDPNLENPPKGPNHENP